MYVIKPNLENTFTLTRLRNKRRDKGDSVGRQYADMIH